MSEVTALFWDLGGVILSNAWDHKERAAAIRQFGLDAEDFEDRHSSLYEALECGEITLGTYLNRAIFYRRRSFSPEEFTAFMLEQSSENPEGRAVLDEVTNLRRYLLVALNNESAEMNAYRVRKFQLTRNFTAFLTSCYLGMRKPDDQIYRRALAITQRAPEECIFIDDRTANLDAANRIGMGTIHFQDPMQLRQELAARGVSVSAMPARAR